MGTRCQHVLNQALPNTDNPDIAIEAIHVILCPLVLVGLTYYSSSPQDAPALRAQISNPTQTSYVVDAVDLRLDRDDAHGVVLNQGAMHRYDVLEHPHVRGGSVVNIPINGPWSTDLTQNIGASRLSCHADPIAS
jgi:hypothetical protein